MSQYLTKEEIKQWRSSLEKCTLEEYARRLGKVLEEDKKTNDIIDIVTQNEKRLYSSRENNGTTKEQLLNLAQTAREIEKKDSGSSNINSIKEKLTFLKPLTEREELTFSYFAKNKNEIVYARDLAAILNLPTDYVYKYIKNLRTKIKENVLENATKGGYIFKI